jgi:hypothetical protein
MALKFGNFDSNERPKGKIADIPHSTSAFEPHAGYEAHVITKQNLTKT